MGTGSLFPGVKRPGRGVNHLPSSSARVKERVELYLYSPSVPSWPVLGRTLPSLVHLITSDLSNYKLRMLRMHPFSVVRVIQYLKETPVFRLSTCCCSVVHLLSSSSSGVFLSQHGSGIYMHSLLVADISHPHRPAETNTVLLFYNRDAHPGRHIAWRQSFLRWRVIFVGPQCGTWIVSAFWCLEF